MPCKVLWLQPLTHIKNNLILQEKYILSNIVFRFVVNLQFEPHSALTQWAMANFLL